MIEQETESLSEPPLPHLTGAKNYSAKPESNKPYQIPGWVMATFIAGFLTSSLILRSSRIGNTRTANGVLIIGVVGVVLSSLLFLSYVFSAVQKHGKRTPRE